MLIYAYYALLLFTGVLSIGGIAYYLIAIVATRKLRKSSKLASNRQLSFPPISLLKPLSGVDPGLEDHLESFFQQDYPSFEILFAVRQEKDPAVAVVGRLAAKYPKIESRLIITGEPPYANAKVYSMEKMAEQASYQILVITDSDASVERHYLKAMAQTFEPKEVGVVTNLYRGVGGEDFWSKLEALGMSTEFMAGVVVANHLEGMKFTLGPSMAIRADCLRAIGGFAAMADYLADDFVLGAWASDAGYRVELSTHVINHHATSPGFRNSFKHRLRWNRSSRFSRPAGYIGQGFTYTLSWAIVFCLLSQTWWGLAVLLFAIAVRLFLAFELSVRLLNDLKSIGLFWLIPLQDLLSFVTWLGGFLGKEIVWRNERYRLLKGGKFAPLAHRI
jgi:ceramide glucosyltransferase